MTAAMMSPADLGSRVGTELGVSEWVTLDQPRIDEFAHCTGDRQWIHVDVDRARRESPYKDTVAHGYLTLSLLAPTTFEIMTANVDLKQAVNYGLEKVRFVAPVRAGRRVRNHIRIVAVEDKGGGRFLVTTENTVEIEGEDKPALVAVALAMLMG
jgi:acyl dehydratase